MIYSNCGHGIKISRPLVYPQFIAHGSCSCTPVTEKNSSPTAHAQHPSRSPSPEKSSSSSTPDRDGAAAGQRSVSTHMPLATKKNFRKFVSTHMPLAEVMRRARPARWVPPVPPAPPPPAGVGRVAALHGCLFSLSGLLQGWQFEMGYGARVNKQLRPTTTAWEMTARSSPHRCRTDMYCHPMIPNPSGSQ